MNRKGALVAAMLLLPFAVGAMDTAFYQAGPLMKANRMGHFSAMLPNGKVLLFGGHGTGFTSLNTMEIYNPSLNSFTIDTMKYIHDGSAVCELADSTWLVAGGADNLGVAPGEKTAEIYNAATNTFTSCGSMTHSRMLNSGALLSNGNVLIAGGWYDVTSATYGELFSSSSKTFSATGALTTPRSNPVVLATDDGGAVVCGGYYYTGGTYYESVEYYNTATNSFSVQSSHLLSSDTGWHVTYDMYQRPMSSQQLSTREYLLGAWRVSGGSNEYGLMTFSPATKSFSRITLASPLPKSDSASFINAPILDKVNNVAYWFAVMPTAATYTIQLYVIDLARHTWHLVPQSFVPGYYLISCGMNLLQNGNLLVSGGTSANNYYTNFDPVANTFLVTPPTLAVAVTDTAFYQAGPLMKANRMGHFSAMLPNGKVLLFGGHGTGFTSLNTMEIYNPSLNSFTIDTMKYIHDGSAVCELADSTWLVAGGADNLGVAPGEKTAEIYNAATNTFTSCGSMTHSRMLNSGALLSNGNVLIAGGWYDVTSATYGELFSSSSKTFSATGALTTPRSNPVVLATDDGGAVVCGGYYYTGGTYYESVEYYNTATNSFSVQSSHLLSSDTGWHVTYDMYQRPMSSQQLSTREYLLGAWRVSGGSNEYGLMTFSPATKSFSRITLASPLPKSDSASFINAPILDKVNNVAYWFAVMPTAATYTIQLYVIDLARHTWHLVPQSFVPGYYLISCGMNLLQNGNLLVSGGTSANNYYTNFDPVANTFLVTPPTLTGVKVGKSLLLRLGGPLLGQNYPNPCKGLTRITYRVPAAGKASLRVFDVSGREVATLVNGMKNAGIYEVTLSTARFPRGTYIYQLRCGNSLQARKMIIVK